MNRSNVQIASVVDGASHRSRMLYRIGARAMAVLTVSVFLLWSQPASADSIPLANSGFDDSSMLSGPLTFDNNLDFLSNPYGWTEYDIDTGLPSSNMAPQNNVGPINVAPFDFPTEATSGQLALYMQNINVRVDQTTGHVISASDTAFSLTVDVGRNIPNEFGTPLVLLYADNAGVKTTIKSQGLAAPEAGTWVTETLALVPADFLPYVGQSIGISLQHPGANNQVTWYDTVALDVTTSTTAHPGDFDSDGDVDGADFVAWQTHFPTATGATLADGDADADGDVDGADFVVWQTNFPFTPGSGVSSVPEPNSIGLALLATLGFAAARFSKRQAA